MRQKQLLPLNGVIRFGVTPVGGLPVGAVGTDYRPRYNRLVIGLSQPYIIFGHKPVGSGGAAPPPNTLVGGTIIATSGGLTRKKWQELLAELRKEAEAKGLKERKQAAKAQAAIQRAAREAEEAVQERLVNEENARQLAELVVSAKTAEKTAHALRYANEIKRAIDRLREEEDEDDALFLMGML